MCKWLWHRNSGLERDKQIIVFAIITIISNGGKRGGEPTGPTNEEISV